MKREAAVDPTDVDIRIPELVQGDEGPVRRSARFVKVGLVA